MSLIIAGERSGVGKTTVTLALLSYLQQHGLSAQSFKVGPDYIDPMFHHYVTGRPCRNLDPVLTSETYVQDCFATHTQAVECVLVEGVMGLFDGASAESLGSREWRVRSGGIGSTAHVARLLDLPVLLVVDCSRISHSIAALVQGYATFDPALQFAGLVLNRVGSDRHLTLLQAALEPLHIPILGVLRRHDAIAIPDRHLGLLPTAELPELDTLIQRLAHLAHEWFDWERLLPLLRQRAEGRGQTATGNQSSVIGDSSSKDSGQTADGRRQELVASPRPQALASSPWACPTSHSPLSTPPVRIAIAQDAAFSFYYADNLDCLKALGVELVFWSPLQDEALPTNVQGLILGGGFPEMFAAQLAANTSARQTVKQAIAAGLPTYAECGGLMYLCQTIVDFEGQAWEMAGVLPTTAVMGKQLTLGYRQVLALQAGVLVEPATVTWGHEFHRSHLTQVAAHPVWQMTPQDTKEGWYRPNLHASYIHLHWGANWSLPKRFIAQCANFQWTA